MQHAIAYTAAPSQQQVYGAKATINVWDPVIQESNGFSLSQLWILSGSFNGSDLNSIEAGWQVRLPIPFSIAMPSIPYPMHCARVYIIRLITKCIFIINYFRAVNMNNIY